ncbi:MAG: arginine N-succinyltransferase [Robiginitomaculum sp.]|nr:MAG: arginine N-succinyltransferase [Robiginitomaculum sp.]
MYLVRPIEDKDFDAFLSLAELSGPGFTSLPDDPDLLKGRIDLSAKSFKAAMSTPGEEGYLLALEDLSTGQVVGTSAVKVGVGVSKPFFNFRMFSTAQVSAAAERRFDMDVMILVNEYNGSTEVGTLFVHPDARGGGTGGLIAQARYLLIAAQPERFSRTIIAELRGVVDENGYSPFWENLTSKFFHMSFNKADFLSGTTDKQFILDLMPKYPIYTDLLPDDAKAVIGKAHVDGRGAQLLLEREGFTFDRIIDIFDGGPLVSAPRDSLRTLRQSRLINIAKGSKGSQRMRLSNDRIDGFRACGAEVDMDGNTLIAEPAILEALQVKEGDTVRVVDHT